jgi:CHAT domain-containing protein
MIRCAAVLAAVLAAFSTAALSQSDQRTLVVGRADAAPPRLTADILAILDQQKPDAAQIGRLREIAARPVPQTRDPVDLWKFYAERGRAAGDLGMIRQQIEDMRKGYELAPVGTDKWFLYIEFALAEMTGGDLNAAFKRFEEAPRVASNEAMRLSAWGAVASTRAQIGDLAGARKALGEAQSLFGTLQSSRVWPQYRTSWEAIYQRALGNVLRYEGKLAESEAATKRAIASWKDHIGAIPAMERQGWPVPTLGFAHRIMLLWEHHNLLQALLEQSKFAEAEWLLRDSLKRSLSVFGCYSVDTAGTLVRLGKVVFEQGRFEEAALLGRAAIDIYEKVGVAPYATFLGYARGDVASALVEQGRHAEAVALFDQARKGLEQSPDPAEIKIRGASTAWVYALVQAGQSAAAVEQARELYRYELKIYGEQLYAPLEARGFLALALAADGKRDEALREFQAAIPALLATASERSNEEGFGLARTLRLRRVLEAYIALLGSFAAEGKSPGGLDPVAEAFRMTDVARGSSVQRALVAASARAAIRDPALAKLAREEQDAAQRISSLSGILVELLGRPPQKSLPTVIAAMRKDIDELRKRRGEIKQEIEKRFPEYASLIDPKPLPLEAARAVLAPGEALIVLYGTDSHTFVWALPREGAAKFHVAALGRTERDRIVATLRKALAIDSLSLAGFPRFDVGAAHALYNQLLAPLEPAWGGAQNLLVVPHGSLGQLPFSVLVTAPGTVAEGPVALEGYKSIAWLARKVAVTQLPSVNTLASLRSVTRSHRPVKSFAGFGDPVFAPSAVAQAAPARSVSLRSAPFADTTRISSQVAQLLPLPDTAEELQSIAKVMGASEQDLYLGRRASEQNVKKADLSSHRVIAFATHGLVSGDLDGLTQPALALSNPQVTGEKDADGLLAMDEILGMRLNADWVVLSACNTAAAEGAGGEAVSGLGRAFFYAGARALLVSNWPVETVSAKLLTTEVFRRQAADPKLSRAAALRQSMLHLMDNESGRDKAGKPLFSYAHPTFWAPFSLVGDGS